MCVPVFVCEFVSVSVCFCVFVCVCVCLCEKGKCESNVFDGERERDVVRCSKRLINT